MSNILNDINSTIETLKAVNESALKMRNSDDTFSRGQASGMDIVTRNMINLLTEIYNRGVQNENK